MLDLSWKGANGLETALAELHEDASADGARRFALSGALTVDAASALSKTLSEISAQPGQPLVLDGQGLTLLDTAGAWLLHRTVRDLTAAGASVRLDGFKPAHAKLIQTVAQNEAKCKVHQDVPDSWTAPIADVGEATVRIVTEFGTFLAFVGIVVLRFFRVALKPWRIRWNALTTQVQETGLYALPIIGLMSFLIGIVLVQQGAFQLRQFGAEVYVVNLVAISTLRELGILLTAIMVAGRSGSAFTAQIGSMKLQEEVDAMRTMGLDPIDVLVVPRVMALVLVMPLLAFYANIMSLIGGAVFAWLNLGIPIPTFVERMQESATLNDFWVGMIKAPVFGMIIAIAGCFQGMRVEGGAQSVGERTTTSVVQGIFLVIVLDAFFAIFFTTIGM
jgi:phospholipid/cholesterol/gamma-HCH transport system permease protein